MANARSMEKAVSVYKWGKCEDLQRISFEGKETVRELGRSFSSCNWKNPFVKLYVVRTRSYKLESKNERVTNI